MMAKSEAAEKQEPIGGKEREILVRGKKSGVKWKEAVTPKSKGMKDEVVKQSGAGGKN
jgi:hypothetical protein